MKGWLDIQIVLFFHSIIYFVTRTTLFAFSVLDQNILLTYNESNGCKNDILFKCYTTQNVSELI